MPTIVMHDSELLTKFVNCQMGQSELTVNLVVNSSPNKIPSSHIREAYTTPTLPEASSLLTASLAGASSSSSSATARASSSLPDSFNAYSCAGFTASDAAHRFAEEGSARETDIAAKDFGYGEVLRFDADAALAVERAALALAKATKAYAELTEPAKREAEGNLAQFDQLVEAFRVIDRDGRGVVSAAELRQVLTGLRVGLTDADIHDVLLEADNCGSGQVHYEKELREGAGWRGHWLTTSAWIERSRVSGMQPRAQ